MCFLVFDFAVYACEPTRCRPRWKGTLALKHGIPLGLHFFSRCTTPSGGDEQGHNAYSAQPIPLQPVTVSCEVADP
eukprot:3051752-Rhodomonas_salina.1